jgi:branched-chain amino acid aminotransferase
MNATVSVNGRISDAASASISVFDHGFLYGEGIYETLRTYSGVPFLYERHARRLRHSAALMALDVPFEDAALLRDIHATIAAHPGGLPESYIRVLVTRGIGELSYNPSATPRPSVVIIVKPFPAPPAQSFTSGILLSMVSIRRNHPQALNPMIKSNNLLNNALAMQEALRRGAFEGVMRNYKGELAECTQSNLFVVKDGAALTPPIEAGLLPGITREFLFEVGAETGIPVREAIMKDADLHGADESFLTSTTRELVPIVQVDDRTIGSGVPGPITRALLDAFRRKADALTTGAAAGART